WICLSGLAWRAPGWSSDTPPAECPLQIWRDILQWRLNLPAPAWSEYPAKSLQRNQARIPRHPDLVARQRVSACRSQLEYAQKYHAEPRFQRLWRDLVRAAAQRDRRQAPILKPRHPQGTRLG